MILQNITDILNLFELSIKPFSGPFLILLQKILWNLFPLIERLAIHVLFMKELFGFFFRLLVFYIIWYKGVFFSGNYFPLKQIFFYFFVPRKFRIHQECVVLRNFEISEISFFFTLIYQAIFILKTRDIGIFKTQTNQ